MVFKLIYIYLRKKCSSLFNVTVSVDPESRHHHTDVFLFVWTPQPSGNSTLASYFPLKIGELMRLSTPLKDISEPAHSLQEKYLKV